MHQGKKMHAWAKDLWPLNRSLTGQGTRQTLEYLKSILPNLNTHKIDSGTAIFDWNVPDEWECNEAFIIAPDGQKLCDIKDNNLHLMGYSEPVDKTINLEELQKHLFSLPEQPDFIPYVTSYYRKAWGFCLTHRQRQQLKAGNYKVIIKTRLFKGTMDYADLIIPGKSDDEILFSTNICHPSLANNELSGPIMVAALAQWVEELKDRHYTYRFVFLPETVGAVAYVNKHLEHLKKHVIGGYQVVCCGDERTLSYVSSPYGDNSSDSVAEKVLSSMGGYKRYSYLSRGSDERQYCAPHVRLPMASITCSKYGEYPEYHNSGDDLVNVVTARGLQRAFDAYTGCIKEFEKHRTYNKNKRQTKTGCPTIKVTCEPQLGKRGLYDDFDKDDPLNDISARDIINIIAYCDGTNTERDIASLTKTKEQTVNTVVTRLTQEGLLS